RPRGAPPTERPRKRRPTVSNDSVFKFPCPHCGEKIECEKHLSGTEADCPYCDCTLEIPHVARSKVAQAATPAAQSTPPVESPKKSGNALWILALVFLAM